MNPNNVMLIRVQLPQGRFTLLWLKVTKESAQKYQAKQLLRCYITPMPMQPVSIGTIHLLKFQL